MQSPTGEPLLWVSPYLYAQQGRASCSSDWAAPGARPVPVSEASHCTTQHVRQLPEHTRRLGSLAPSQSLCRKVCMRPTAGRSENICELGTRSLQRPKPPSELGLLSKSSQRPGVCMHGVKKQHQACLCAWLGNHTRLTLKSTGSRHTQGRRQSRRRAHRSNGLPWHRQPSRGTWRLSLSVSTQQVVTTGHWLSLQLPNQVSRLSTDSET